MARIFSRRGPMTFTCLGCGTVVEVPLMPQVDVDCPHCGEAVVIYYNCEPEGE
jgi:predicted RNA-binding Zn-ribbon protein involved in translation (DUF1610 family)